MTLTGVALLLAGVALGMCISYSFGRRSASNVTPEQERAALRLAYFLSLVEVDREAHGQVTLADVSPALHHEYGDVTATVTVRDLWLLSEVRA